MLRFTLKSAQTGTPEELFVFADIDGLNSLVAQLNFLKEGKTEHVHLMTRAWGGAELDEAASGDSTIHHVKICLEKQ